MEKMKLNCPSGHGEMKLTHKEKQGGFRGEGISYHLECYICPVCGLEAGTLKQGIAVQKAMGDAYRKKVGLLTSQEIINSRKKMHLTQETLAGRIKVGIASVKRWEGGVVQSKSMDMMLRRALAGEFCGDSLTGNRAFSIPRVKLALRKLESLLGINVLKEKDKKMLYATKYVWYIDMVAYRETGQSITGATYAALPYGPQLNNYRDLVEEIINADEAQAEPLTSEEIRAIEDVASRFPRTRSVYEASHRELVWQEKSAGSMIPYSDAHRLTEI